MFGVFITFQYMLGTLKTFFISFFCFKFFEITNLFSKILSLVTQKSISNLFYSNLTLKTLNSKNVKFGEYGKKLGRSNYLSFTYDYQNVEF